MKKIGYNSTVHAAVVQAGRVESQRRIETVLVAVVLVGVLRKSYLLRSNQEGDFKMKQNIKCAD